MAFLKHPRVKRVLVSVYIQILLVVMISPILVQLQNKRAEMYMNANYSHAAIGHFKRVLWLSHDNVWALNWMGYCFEDLRKFDQADMYYSRAIAAAPDHGTAYYCRGALRFKQKQFDAAYADFINAARYPGIYQAEAKVYVAHLKRHVKK